MAKNLYLAAIEIIKALEIPMYLCVIG